MSNKQVIVDFTDAIEWIQCSVEIFYDEPAERKQNIKNLLRVLESMTQDDVDRIVYDLDTDITQSSLQMVQRRCNRDDVQ